MLGGQLMSKNKTWLTEIIEAMEDLGGHGYYKDIYDKIEERNNMEGLRTSPNWQATVRREIESASSDSQAHLGTKDIFYSVEGLGKGHWGLRNFTPNDGKVDLTDDDAGFKEGKKLLRKHICRERNPKVIKIAKENFLTKHGKLYCEACGFRFKDKYDIADEFIEGHHIIPISELPEDAETKPEDIVMLCSNCHRVIHKKRPWLKRHELNKLFKK
jgi:putative restriction endonuclease